MAIFWVVIVLGGSCPKWQLSVWQLYAGGSFPCGSCPDGSCPGVSYLYGSRPDGSCPGWQLPWVADVLGGSYLGGSCPVAVVLEPCTAPGQILWLLLRPVFPLMADVSAFWFGFCPVITCRLQARELFKLSKKADSLLAWILKILGLLSLNFLMCCHDWGG